MYVCMYIYISICIYIHSFRKCAIYGHILRDRICSEWIDRSSILVTIPFLWSCTRQWCYALVWGGGGGGWGGGMFTFMWSCTRHGGYVIAHAMHAIVWHIYNTCYRLTFMRCWQWHAVALWKKEQHSVERNSCPAACTVIRPTVWTSEIQNVAAIGFCKVLSIFDDFLVHVLHHKMLIFN